MTADPVCDCGDGGSVYAGCPVHGWSPSVVEDRQARERLEYLRGELRGERISYGELAELQGLIAFIEPGDLELLEAAGVPEGEA